MQLDFLTLDMCRLLQIPAMHGIVHPLRLSAACWSLSGPQEHTVREACTHKAASITRVSQVTDEKSHNNSSSGKSCDFERLLRLCRGGLI